MLIKKNVLFFVLVLVSLNTFAGEQKKYCQYSNAYQEAGWVIHAPEEFKAIEKEITKLLGEGQRDGTIVFDMSGVIVTADTISKEDLLLGATMWDDLKTNRDVMYGDVAILKIDGTNERAEIRWFDGKNRNIIYNPNFLTCFSEAPPYVANSVL